MKVLGRVKTFSVILNRLAVSKLFFESILSEFRSKLLS